LLVSCFLYVEHAFAKEFIFNIGERKEYQMKTVTAPNMAPLYALLLLFLLLGAWWVLINMNMNTVPIHVTDLYPSDPILRIDDVTRGALVTTAGAYVYWANYDSGCVFGVHTKLGWSYLIFKRPCPEGSDDVESIKKFLSELLKRLEGDNKTWSNYQKHWEAILELAKLYGL
jgi:hypothetical protein